MLLKGKFPVPHVLLKAKFPVPHVLLKAKFPVHHVALKGKVGHGSQNGLWQKLAFS